MDKINYKNLFKTKYKKERIKFLFLSFGMLFAAVFIIMKLSDTYAKFASEVKLKSNIDKAIYLINSTKISFDIDPDRIVPSDKPYQYKFSISNFSDNKISDIEYSPNNIDKERFILYMNDGNLVYITLTKFNKISYYDNIYSQLDNHKGILYLDNGNHFEIKE